MPKGDPWKAMELKMPVAMVEAVDIVARDYGMSRSEYIRHCVEIRLDAENNRRALAERMREFDERLGAREAESGG